MKKKLPKKSATIATILQKFQIDLLKVYGEHLQKIILFGSYARGDFRENSDIDLLLLFDNSFTDFQKNDLIYDIICDYLLDNQVVISPNGATVSDFKNKITPLYLNIKREGITVWKQSIKL